MKRVKHYSEPEKVKALRVHILEECEQQGFTVCDFEWLVIHLQIDLDARKREAYDVPF